MFLTVPMAAQVRHFAPASPLVAAARMAANDEGYDMSRGNFNFNEILTLDGKDPFPRYMMLALYQGDHLLRDYAIRIKTGDVVDLTKCEILRYPNLLQFKRARTRKLGAHEVSTTLIAAELSCDSLPPVGGPGPASSSDKLSPSLKRTLATQHFSGMITGDVTFRTLGTFPCGNRSLRVIFYTWSETTPGVDPHGQARILLMDGKTYLGSYIVEDPPEIHGDVLQFPHSNYGDTITCGKKGVLPKNAWLDGELNPLFK